jgi:transcriptional regulator with XRE-family HTH domain
MADEMTDAGVKAPFLHAGERLRAARVAKELDLTQVAAETRIPQRHLVTIEQGDFASLPSRTYAIGFARTYARMVGEKPDEIVAMVREELGDSSGRSETAMRETFDPGDPARVPSSRLAWAGGFAALLLLVGGFVFYQTYFSPGSGPSSLIGPSDDIAEASADDVQGIADDAPSQAAIDANAAVTFTSEEDGTWVKFYDAAGERLFEAQMNAGDSYTIPSTAVGPQVWTGRPYALAITIGGKEVPKLSLVDEVIKDVLVTAEALAARPPVPAAVAPPAAAPAPVASGAGPVPAAPAPVPAAPTAGAAL